jgi:hypothetical protein
MRRAASLAIPLSLALLASSCGDSNVGSIFGPPGGGGNGPGGGGNSSAPIEGALIVTGAPQVEFVRPSGGTNVSTETPIVVSFNETVAASTLTASTFQVRPVGASPVSGTILLFEANRLAVLLPNAPLATSTSYEVVLGNTVRDLDGAALAGSSAGVVATFTTESSATANTTPSVVAVFPRNDSTNVPRESSVIAVFSEPVDPTTVFPFGFTVQVAGTPPTPVQGVPSFAGGNRIARLAPLSPLALGATVQFVLSSSIQNDDFTPVSLSPPVMGGFTVTPFDAPLSVQMATSPPNTVNQANESMVPVDVDLAPGSLAGDTVRVLVHEASGTNGIASSTSGVAGGGTVSLDLNLSQAVGDGNLVVGAFVLRGGNPSVVVLGPSARKDTVAPVVSSFGPPAGPNASTFLTTLRLFSLTASASETLGPVTVTLLDGSPTPPSAMGQGLQSGSFFWAPPLDADPVLDATTVAIADTFPIDVDVQDTAGNPASNLMGSVLFRGIVGGGPVGTTLRVRVYDESTLAGVASASVLLEPGLSQVPPAAGSRVETTDGSGLVVFGDGVPPSDTPLVSLTHTVTAGKPGFDPATLVGTSRAFVSLPLRPTAGATATLAGTVVGAPSGLGLRFTTNLLPDRAAFGTFDHAPMSPTEIPMTAIEAGRLPLLTVFATNLPPSAPYFNFTFALLAPPASPGSTIFLAPFFPTAPSLTPTTADDPIPLPSQTIDLSGASGLDPLSLVENPRVLVNGHSPGFPGLIGFGLGFTVPGGSPTTYASSADLSPLGSLLSPTPHFAASARDAAGAVSEARVPLFPPLSAGGTVPLPATPAVSPLASPIPPSPVVTFADTIAASGGIFLLRIVDSSTPPRSWRITVPDGGGGSISVRVPALGQAPGWPAQASLQVPGTWTFRAEAYGLPGFGGPGFGFDSFSFSDLDASATSFARSAPVTAAVQ